MVSPANYWVYCAQYKNFIINLFDQPHFCIDIIITTVLTLNSCGDICLIGRQLAGRILVTQRNNATIAGARAYTKCGYAGSAPLVISLQT